jgi:hypothetical protein
VVSCSRLRSDCPRLLDSRPVVPHCAWILLSQPRLNDTVCVLSRQTSGYLSVHGNMARCGCYWLPASYASVPKPSFSLRARRGSLGVCGMDKDLSLCIGWTGSGASLTGFTQRLENSLCRLWRASQTTYTFVRDMRGRSSRDFSLSSFDMLNIYWRVVIPRFMPWRFPPPALFAGKGAPLTLCLPDRLTGGTRCPILTTLIQFTCQHSVNWPSLPLISQHGSKSCTHQAATRGRARQVWRTQKCRVTRSNEAM